MYILPAGAVQLTGVGDAAVKAGGEVDMLKGVPTRRKTDPRPLPQLKRSYGPKPYRVSWDELFPGADLTAEHVEFGAAMERYKRDHQRPFPHFTEALAVAKALGYRRVAEPVELPRVRGRE